jgi:hypothetical protein
MSQLTLAPSVPYGGAQDTKLAAYRASRRKPLSRIGSARVGGDVSEAMVSPPFAQSFDRITGAGSIGDVDGPLFGVKG